MAEREELGDLIESAVSTEKRIPVHISYEIIRLFSEGLYQSPLVTLELSGGR